MIYTGIGARKTPGKILHVMVQVGEYMATAGHTLRSGGAQGADRAFEIGCDRLQGKKEIYLPAPNFNQHQSTRYHVSQEAMDVAALFHPAWGRLNDFSRKLMGRNSYQMLGADLKTKADFVVCWTLGSEIIGGTGQALRMALYYDIPIFNLGGASLRVINDRLEKFLEKNS